MLRSWRSRHRPSCGGRQVAASSSRLTPFSTATDVIDCIANGGGKNHRLVVGVLDLDHVTAAPAVCHGESWPQLCHEFDGAEGSVRPARGATATEAIVQTRRDLRHEPGAAVPPSRSRSKPKESVRYHVCKPSIRWIGQNLTSQWATMELRRTTIFVEPRSVFRKGLKALLANSRYHIVGDFASAAEVSGVSTLLDEPELVILGAPASPLDMPANLLREHFAR